MVASCCIASNWRVLLAIVGMQKFMIIFANNISRKERTFYVRGIEGGESLSVSELSVDDKCTKYLLFLPGCKS